MYDKDRGIVEIAEMYLNASEMGRFRSLMKLRTNRNPLIRNAANKEALAMLDLIESRMGTSPIREANKSLPRTS